MNDQPYTPPQGPPQTSAPLLFDRIGAERLHRFSLRHYQNLSASTIADLFPSDPHELAAAAERQADFLTGVMGGPPVYRDKHGPPRMRARHLPFVIDEAARQEWLRCFRSAIVAEEGLGLNPVDQKALLNWIDLFSGWMVNTERA
jgi:hemoglobin